MDVIPVFVPPRETGFQASIENYDGRWQRSVWERFRFKDIQAVQRQSALYVEAMRNKNGERQETAPARWQIPKNWTLHYSTPLKGKVIFIRRTIDSEYVEAMGHWWKVQGAGVHKLVRIEVDLTRNQILFYRIRRREPHKHELIAQAHCKLPMRTLRE